MATVVDTTYFPNLNKYFSEISISSDSRGTANIYGRVSGISAVWDWYVNRAGYAYVYLYLDNDNTCIYAGDLAYWGANGSGLNGVQSSETVLLAAGVAVSPNSKLRMTIDCRKGPVISTGGRQIVPGYLDTGYFTPDWSSVVSFLSPPVLSSLYNNVKYNNDAAISLSPTSINIGAILASGSDGATNWYWKLKGASRWYDKGNTNPFSTSQETTLTPGTPYVIEVCGGNAAGLSNVKEITIRTRHNAPVLILQDPDIGGSEINIEWESDKQCQQISYQLKNVTEEEDWSEWVDIKLYNNDTSGIITITDLEPGEYKFKVKVQSTTSYDFLWSNESMVGAIAIEPAHLIEPIECVFGQDFKFRAINPNKEEEAILTCNVIVYCNDKYIIESSYYKIKPGEELNMRTYVISQTIWDILYKLLEGTNTVLPLKIRLTSIINRNTENEKSFREEYDATLTLTGNMKTMRVSSNGVVDRIKGWISEENNLVRCVAWVGGTDNKPKRSI